MQLFHYCSNRSFLSILQNREVILSELTLSNDSLEGAWVRRIFSDLCTEDELLKDHREKLLDRYDFLSRAASAALGFCLSEDGDLLSQWRGYADNAAGVSIGFTKDYLAGDFLKMNHVGLNQIKYEIDEQKSALRYIIDGLKNKINDGAFKSIEGGLLWRPTEDEKSQIPERPASSGRFFSG